VGRRGDPGMVIMAVLFTMALALAADKAIRQ
jgi:hypothetical protein